MLAIGLANVLNTGCYRTARGGPHTCMVAAQLSAAV